MFLAFEHGVLYVLSFATIALVFATAGGFARDDTLPQHLAAASQAVSGMYDEFTVVPTHLKRYRRAPGSGLQCSQGLPGPSPDLMGWPWA
jgi:hypothetical protein